MTSPTLYYIRHGETEWNAAGRFQGWRDIPLNERGRAQAAQAGGILRDLLARERRDHEALPFIASPLGRARETMELLRASLGAPRAGYAIEERLRELGFGRWEGMTLAEMAADNPAIFKARNSDKWGVAAPDGESYGNLQARVAGWLESLAQDAVQDAVVVAHGGTMRALMVARGVESATEATERYIEQGVVYVFEGNRLTKYG
jgi:probable phosphoglycerate mutase